MTSDTAAQAAISLSATPISDDERLKLRTFANAIRVNDHIFLSAGYPRTADALTQLGFRIVTLQTREIAKIDAGLSCMSLRWKA